MSARHSWQCRILNDQPHDAERKSNVIASLVPVRAMHPAASLETQRRCVIHLIVDKELDLVKHGVGYLLICLLP